MHLLFLWSLFNPNSRSKIFIGIKSIDSVTQFYAISEDGFVVLVISYTRTTSSLFAFLCGRNEVLMVQLGGVTTKSECFEICQRRQDNGQGCPFSESSGMSRGAPCEGSSSRASQHRYHLYHCAVLQGAKLCVEYCTLIITWCQHSTS